MSSYSPAGNFRLKVMAFVEYYSFDSQFQQLLIQHWELTFALTLFTFLPVDQLCSFTFLAGIRVMDDVVVDDVEVFSASSRKCGEFLLVFTID